MLETLAIRGYRGFESCRLTNLARVNLVVGRNNCGKTTVLEAIELLASGGSPLAFLGPINRRRGAGPHPASSDISHLLFGHTCVPGAGFDLSSDDTGRTFSVKILPLDEIGGDPQQAWFPNGAQGDQVSPGHPDKVMMPMFGMRIVSRTSADAPERTIELPIMEDGSFPFGKPTGWLRNRPSDVPVRIYSAESLDPMSMSAEWNTVLTRGIDAEVVSDMRLLEPALESIHFLTNPGAGSGILLGLRGGGRRLPIDSYGDGMRKLLAMRLSFVGAAGGYLLIDEIGTGFHWTIMEDMWRVVVEVAGRSNVQIFATTHSYDCIRGLGSLLQSRPDLDDEVSIQKIHGSLPQAVNLRGDQIRVAVEQEIEVR